MALTARITQKIHEKGFLGRNIYRFVVVDCAGCRWIARVLGSEYHAFNVGDWIEVPRRGPW